MVKIHIKTGRVILEIPNLEGEANTQENNAILNKIRQTLNMQMFGIFIGIDSVVDDAQNYRVSAENPTGEFVRVAISKASYEINPFVISELKGKDGSIIPPIGDNEGIPYYPGKQLSEEFEKNYF